MYIFIGYIQQRTLLFQMPNDMENFMEYHITGSVSQIRMKPDCLPTKFHCQPDRKRTSDLSRPTAVKRQRKSLIEECLKDKDQNQGLVLQRCDECNEVPSGSSGTIHTIPILDSFRLIVINPYSVAEHELILKIKYHLALVPYTCGSI